jgi:predicted DCC family thiol-disulfide oxidoreductase YuxK
VSLIILYDGVCGLCNRFVNFVIKHDRHDQFRFASLQGRFATGLLHRRGIDSRQLATIYLVVGPEMPSERLLSRSAAVTEILSRLGGIWKISAGLLRALPRWLQNWGYDRVAGNRYRIFGRYDSCPLPNEKDRNKFLGDDSGDLL